MPHIWMKDVCDNAACVTAAPVSSVVQRLEIHDAQFQYPVLREAVRQVARGKAVVDKLLLCVTIYCVVCTTRAAVPLSVYTW